MRGVRRENRAERKRPIIVLSGSAVLKVERGALVVKHTPDGERYQAEQRFDIDDLAPQTILFDGRGEFISGEALRWCASRGVVIVLPDGPGRMMTFVHSSLEAAEGAGAIADVSPHVLKAQAAASLDDARTLTIARAIVAAKIETEANAVPGRALSLSGRRGSADHVIRAQGAHVSAARSLAQLLQIEAKASAVYWRAQRNRGLREAKDGDLPRSWRRFANRNKGARFLGNKNASHPINAMLNYCFVVEAGRIARALHARGLALQIGFLHVAKKGRNSLVWDALEIVRAEIGERVFAYVEGREFGRGDFVAAGRGALRLKRGTIGELLALARLPQERIEAACDFILALVVNAGPRTALAPLSIAGFDLGAGGVSTNGAGKSPSEPNDPLQARPGRGPSEKRSQNPQSKAARSPEPSKGCPCT